LRLKPDQYIKVKGLDGREKLFNGSIIVKFKSPEDLQAFSLRNEVVLLNNLPDIGRGVFKIDDIYNFNEKLDQLKSNNPNIERVELNTIDISIRPK
jgi:DNA/RNA endonuclease YhcR with UshA esterase domain